MGMRTSGIPWVLWDSHGNGNAYDYVRKWKQKYGNGNKAMGMGTIFLPVRPTYLSVVSNRKF